MPSVYPFARVAVWVDYKLEYFWWEPIESLRKLTLTCFVLFFDSTHESARVLVALLLSLAFLAVQMAIQPLARPEDNSLIALVHMALVLIYLAVLVLKVIAT